MKINATPVPLIRELSAPGLSILPQSKKGKIFAASLVLIAIGALAYFVGSYIRHLRRRPNQEPLGANVRPSNRTVEEVAAAIQSLQIQPNIHSLNQADAENRLASVALCEIGARLNQAAVRERLADVNARTQDVLKRCFCELSASNAAEYVVEEEDCRLLVSGNMRRVILISHLVAEGGCKRVYYSLGQEGLQIAKEVRPDKSSKSRDIIARGHEIWERVVRVEEYQPHPALMPVELGYTDVENDAPKMWIFESYEPRGDYAHFLENLEIWEVEEARVSLIEQLENMVPILEAVQHLHSHGTVHLDIKAQNIQMTAGGIKLGDPDFVTNEKWVLAGDKGDRGTRKHMPPEIVQRKKRRHFQDSTYQDCYTLGYTLGKIRREICKRLSSHQLSELQEIIAIYEEAENLLQTMSNPDNKNPEAFDEEGRSLVAARAAYIIPKRLRTYRSQQAV